MGCSSSDIFLIKAETYANSGDFGFPCLNGDNGNYLKRFIGSSISSICVDQNEIAGLYGTIQGNCDSNEVWEYQPKVNQYGNVINQEVYYKLSSNQMSKYLEFSQGNACGGCCPEGGIFIGNFITERVQGITTQDTANCNRQNGTPPGCDPSDNFCFSANGNCFTYGIDPPEEFTCKLYKYSEFEDCIQGQGGTLSKSNINLLEPVTYDLLFPLAKDAVPKKLEIYENNLPQDSQGNKCQGENYGPNGCYGFPAPNAGFAYDTLHAPTGLQDNSPSYSVITQKWRVRLGDTENFVKNNLSEKYTLYVYYYTGENPDTSITPCCNSCNCFDGIILKQKDITLTYNNNKKGDYILSQDYLEFDNFDYSGPSKNLYYCSK
jgi:hypothetical protein